MIFLFTFLYGILLREIYFVLPKKIQQDIFNDPKFYIFLAAVTFYFILNINLPGSVQ